MICDNCIIEESLRRGFGSMNKNDYEILIFHLLRELSSDDKNSLHGLSSYAISKKLLVPESKVKRLLYESDLRYSKSDDMKKELMDVMKSVHFLKDETTIKFAIKKKLLRQYLADELAKKDRFMDSSFNSEIVTISTGDLYCIYETLYESEAQEMLKEVRTRSKNKDLPFVWQDILRLIAQTYGKNVLGKAGEAIVDFSWETVSKSLKTLDIFQQLK